MYDVQWDPQQESRTESEERVVGMEQVSRRAANITTLDELDAATPILHLDDIGPSLLAELKAAVALVCPKCAKDPEDDVHPTSADITLPVPAQLTWQSPANPESIAIEMEEEETQSKRRRQDRSPAASGFNFRVVNPA